MWLGNIGNLFALVTILSMGNLVVLVSAAEDEAHRHNNPALPVTGSVTYEVTLEDPIRNQQQMADDDPCDLLWDSVEPCTCVDSVLDCGAVGSETDFAHIPGFLTGQSLGFDLIRLNGQPNLTTIPPGAFGRLYATGRYEFNWNPNLLSIGEEIFPTSCNDPEVGLVEIQAISNPKLVHFPFKDLEDESCSASVAPGLERIDLTSSNLKKIPWYGFGSFGWDAEPGKATILLSDNDLRELEPYAFARVAPNVSLFLTGNKNLKTLTSDSLSLYGEGVRLYMEDCGVSLFEPGFISDAGEFPALLNLSNNQIVTLEEEVWRGMLDKVVSSGQLTMITLHRNPLRCDCGMKWLRLNDQYRRIFQDSVSVDSLLCDDGSSNLISLWDLNLSEFDDCSN